MKTFFNLARFVGLPLLLISAIIKRIVLFSPDIAELNKFVGGYSTFKLDIAILIMFVLFVISIVMFIKNIFNK